jgi:transposase InsO family protein
LMDELAKRAGFRWNYTTAYNPRANGKAERVHRPLRATLRAYCLNNQRLWAQALPGFTFSVNNTPTKAMVGGRVSANMFVFGKDMTPHELVFRPTSWGRADEALAFRLQSMDEARRMVKVYVQAQRREDESASSDDTCRVFARKYCLGLCANSAKGGGL